MPVVPNRPEWADGNLETTQEEPTRNSHPLHSRTRIPIRRVGSISLSDLLDAETQLIDHSDESSELSYHEHNNNNNNIYTNDDLHHMSPPTPPITQPEHRTYLSSLRSEPTTTNTNIHRDLPPTRRPHNLTHSPHLVHRGPELTSFNNNILRSVNRGTPPFMPNTAFPRSSDSNFHSRIRNLRNGSFVNDINRHSTESLLNDMRGPMNSDTVFFDVSHDGHPIFDAGLPHQQSHLSIEDKLNQFLEKRQISVFHFDKQLKEGTSMKGSKKRSFNETDGTTNSLEQNHVESIRPQYSSFFTPGITFIGKEKTYNLTFGAIDYQSGVINGTLNFENETIKSQALSKFLNPNNQKRRDGLSILFQGQMINFEDEDLRFHSTLQDDFESSLRTTMNSFQRSKDFYSIYNNCLVRKQLSRWMLFSPFNNLSIGKLLPCITCEHCLAQLQSKFILFRLYIDTDSVIPDLLCCIDRTSGLLEIVTSESVKKSISQHMLLEREIGHYDKEECTVMTMCLERPYYASSSIKLT